MKNTDDLTAFSSNLFTGQATILVVDDAPDNLALISELLMNEYEVKVANSGEKALRIAQTDPPPDLILLDIMMPGMDGYEVCRRLQANPVTGDIPIIFLTAKSDSEDEASGLYLGAVDYIAKPVNPSILLARVRNQLELKIARDTLKGRNNILEEAVRQRTLEVAATRDVTIHAMASLAETRDDDTGNHIRRTQWHVKLLAERLRNHPRFADELDNDTTIELLFKSAPLHDIGKVGIPDRILLKPGRLEPDEMDYMKRHTTIGRDAIVKAEQHLKLEVPFLRLVKDIAYSHHEKWDGSGYPEGLAGDQIPLSARIMAVADVYDALSTRRVYKAAMPHKQTVAIILADRGRHFDPDIVSAFMEVADEFKQIAERYQDADPEQSAHS